MPQPNEQTTVLLTGGTGYIGSHTAVELIEAGFEVVIVDNLSNSNIEVLNGIEKITGIRPRFIKADCADIAAMQQVFATYPSIKNVIHFAASKAVGESFQLPLEYYRNNLVSLLNLLQIITEKGREANLVFSSSCAVYGQPDELPVTEKSPYKKPTSPYGNTKKISEEIILDTIASGKNLTVIALRYFNPIGAHATAEIGELPLGTPLNLIPYITQTAAGVRENLTVYGNDFSTPDGTAIRDYFSVVDLAQGHVMALQRMLNGNCKAKFEAFNLGGGEGSSVLELIGAFEKVSGVKLNYKFAPRRQGDVERVWADTTYAKVELGWEPKISLEQALLSAWVWEKKLRGIR
jgi:UDP-glucose 4-epimerase